MGKDYTIVTNTLPLEMKLLFILRTQIKLMSKSKKKGVPIKTPLLVELTDLKLSLFYY